MQTIARGDLQTMLDNRSDVSLIEVLSEENFKRFHLPGAINVPIGEDFGDRIQQAVPEKDKPVVVYCANTECDASPKAAEQMDDLGYKAVYDYEAGKADWKAAGLPVQE
jgi:rhodanese-related sulfurtransferase